MFPLLVKQHWEDILKFQNVDLDGSTAFVVVPAAWIVMVLLLRCCLHDVRCRRRTLESQPATSHPTEGIATPSQDSGAPGYLTRGLFYSNDTAAGLDKYGL